MFNLNSTACNLHKDELDCRHDVIAHLWVIRNADDVGQQSAIRQIVRHGLPAVLVLVRAIRDKDATLREVALEAFARIGGKVTQLLQSPTTGHGRNDVTTLVVDALRGLFDQGASSTQTRALQVLDELSKHGLLEANQLLTELSHNPQLGVSAAASGILKARQQCQHEEGRLDVAYRPKQPRDIADFRGPRFMS